MCLFELQLVVVWRKMMSLFCRLT